MKIPTSRLVALLATLSITLAAGLLPSTAAADLPELAVTPESHAFGPVNIGGELGEPAEFIVTNPGPEPVHLDMVILDGPDWPSFILIPNASTCFELGETGELEAEESCTLVVQFVPAKEGQNQASLELTSDSPSSPNVMAMTGTGLPELLPDARLEPQKIDFGRHPVGTVALAETITLTSTGTGDLDIGPVTISGSDPGDFDIASNKCTGRVMATGDSCEIEVNFLPTRSGVRSAAINVMTDAAGAGTSSEVTGIGTSEPKSRSSRIRIDGRFPRVGSSGRQVVPFVCTTRAMAACSGSLKILADGRALGKRTGRRVSVGRAQFRVGPGRAQVRIRLSRQVRRMLARRGHIQVKVVATTRQGDGSVRKVEVSRRLRR